MKHQPRLEIQYCKQCRWLLRAAWMLQELLITFEAEIGQAALVPGTGGVFEGESMTSVEVSGIRGQRRMLTPGAGWGRLDPLPGGINQGLSGFPNAIFGPFGVFRE